MASPTHTSNSDVTTETRSSSSSESTVRERVRERIPECEAPASSNVVASQIIHKNRILRWLKKFGRRPMEVTVVVSVPNQISAADACELLRRDKNATNTLSIFGEHYVESDINNIPSDLVKHHRSDCDGPFIGYLCIFRSSGLLCIFDLSKLCEIPDALRNLLEDKTFTFVSFTNIDLVNALRNTDIRLQNLEVLSVQYLLELAVLADLPNFSMSLAKNCVSELSLYYFGISMSLAAVEKSHLLLNAAASTALAFDLAALLMIHQAELQRVLHFTEQNVGFPHPPIWNQDTISLSHVPLTQSVSTQQSNLEPVSMPSSDQNSVQNQLSHRQSRNVDRRPAMRRGRGHGRLPNRRNFDEDPYGHQRPGGRIFNGAEGGPTYLSGVSRREFTGEPPSNQHVPTQRPELRRSPPRINRELETDFRTFLDSVRFDFLRHFRQTGGNQWNQQYTNFYQYWLGEMGRRMSLSHSEHEFKASRLYRYIDLKIAGQRPM